MIHLSRKAFDRARQFLQTQARPLERALYAYWFEDASAELVLRELKRFQNEDGGFGRALEPDLRTPSSSALATGIGLQLLKEIKCPADHPLVRQAVAYLIATCHRETRLWRVAPTDTNEFPHAPWWHDEAGSLERRFDHYRIIPRALIVGLLQHYSSLVPVQWLETITQETVAYIESVSVLGGGGGSDLEYSINLAETERLPRPYQERLVARIRKAIPNVVVRDPRKWSTYCITPLRAVPSPDSIGSDLIQDELESHLDFQIEHQTDEGTWDPPWSWGDSYPEEWKQAKQEWRGHLTLGTLRSLKSFERIE